MAPILPLIGLLAAGGTTYGVKKGLENRKMQRMAGNNPNLIVDAQGFIRTVPGAFQGPSGGTDLKLDTTGGAVPPVALTPGAEMIMPGSNEQVQRLLGLQQARDERAKAQRLTEDDYKFLSQVEKDRLQRTLKGVDTRQRIATRGTLIQQGQLGNQQLAQESMRNRGSVMAAGAGSTFA